MLPEETEKLKTENVTTVMTDTKRKGKFPEFIPGTNVSSYLQTVDIFFLPNKTPENEKALEFLTCVGQETASRIISSFKPDKAATKSLTEITKQFKLLNDEDRNVFAERHRLVTRRQKEGENLDDFAIELQNIVEHCGVNNDTEAMLVQTVFVAGVKNEKTREMMLREGNKDMNLAKLLTKAKTIELAEKESMKMQGTSTGDINSFQQRNGSTHRWKDSHKENVRAERKIDLNGYRDNKRSYASRIVCYNCYQTGHVATHCPNLKIKKPRGNFRPSMNNYERRKAFDRRINQLTSAMEELKSEFCDDDESEDEEQREEMDEDEGENSTINNICLGESTSLAPAFVEVKINGKILLMECDTGAGTTVCSWELYEEKFRNSRIRPCFKRFSVVSGERIIIKGQIKVQVEFNNCMKELHLIIIHASRKFVPLMGRDWLNELVPKWRDAFKINTVLELRNHDQWVKNAVETIKRNFTLAFDDDLTKPIKEVVVDIRIDKTAQPFVHKPYTVAFKHRDKVSAHIDALEKIGILEKVEYASWASPLVVVVKSNKDLRVCMDGSKTVNPHIITHHYPLPLIEDLITNKSGAKRFALIDLRGAYQQLIVSEETKKLLVVNTHKGLYAYTRLPFGVKPAMLPFSKQSWIKFSMACRKFKFTSMIFSFGRNPTMSC